jgi:hypothetical protein
MAGLRAGVVLALIFGTSVADAAPGAWLTNAPESSFTFEGKPIDPRCVANLVEGEGVKSVNLAACSKEMNGKSKAVRRGRSLEAEDTTDGQTESASYEILAQKGARFVVDIEWSGGGSGQFSELGILQVGNTTLAGERFLMNGGDRCNGGLSEANVRNGIAHWSVNITPYDLVYLGGVQTLEAYKDLEASASSCAGTQNFDYDLDQGMTRFVSVSLEPGATVGDTSGLLHDQESWTEHYTYQHCFNAFYNNYKAAKRTELSPLQTAAFAKDFSRTCKVPDKKAP